MLSKNKIKWVRSLEQKKYRESEKLFVVEGEKMVSELLVSNFSTTALFATNNWLKENYQLERYFPTDTNEVTTEEIKKISLQKNPQEVLAIASIPENTLNFNDINNNLSLALDTIQDPGNMGTIIRLSDWFGIKAILCSPDTVDAFSPKVVQSTMGSIFRVNIFYVELEKVLNSFIKQKFPIYGTTLNGNNIYNTELTKTGLILLGNESKGLKTNLQKLTNKNLFIPHYPIEDKKTESLNVSIAAAIICAEFRRRL